MRAKPGRTVCLFDERGNEYEARVNEVHSHRTLLKVVNKKEKKEEKIELTLAQALLKSKSMDWVVQKATELGISRLLPVTADRSVVRIENRGDRKRERWRKIALSAAKQCGRATVPEIAPAVRLMDVDKGQPDAVKFFLDEKNGKPLKKILFDDKVKPFSKGAVIVLVGPEGGWTESEERMILKKGFQPAGLGSRVLRSETSAISSLALIDHFWNN